MVVNEYYCEDNGAPGRSRIHNLLIRSQVLYPIELRALGVKQKFYWCGKEDLNLHGVNPH